MNLRIWEGQSRRQFKDSTWTKCKLLFCF